MSTPLKKAHVLISLFQLNKTAVDGNTRHSLLLGIGSDEISWAHNMHCLELDAASIEHIFLSRWDLQTSGNLRQSSI